MLHQLEGSQAIARAVALSRPKIVCAYPITPQTHIVEELGELVRSGDLKNCEYINVESEMAALSLTIGSQAAGARSYTATSSQGLLYMIEAVYNASGLELPIVMTLGNRAIGSPINIWNDHSDAMSVRDAGWIMLFAETNQEALDLHIQAFKIAEQAKIPVMVCVDGFILTHAYERVDLPTQEDVDSFLPAYVPSFSLNEKEPIAIGTMVPPEYFMEVKYLFHQKYLKSIDIIQDTGNEFNKKFKRNSGGLIHEYHTDSAETIIVTMGSISGTIKDTVDSINTVENRKIGVISIVSYRPFPIDTIQKAVKKAKKIVVIEKAMAPGLGGILSKEIELAVKGSDIHVFSVIAGLGGRKVTSSMIREYLLKNDYPECMFLGLETKVIEKYKPSLLMNCV